VRSFQFKHIIDAGIRALPPVILLVVGLAETGPRWIHEREQAAGTAEHVKGNAGVTPHLLPDHAGLGFADPARRIAQG
jgi:hypothetical protein